MEEWGKLEKELLNALAYEYHLARIFEERSRETSNPYEQSIFERMRDDCRLHAERVRDALKILGFKEREDPPPIPEEFSIFEEGEDFKSALERDLFYAKAHLQLEGKMVSLYKRLSEEVENRMARVLFKANYEDEVIHHREFQTLIRAIEKILGKKAFQGPGES